MADPFTGKIAFVTDYYDVPGPDIFEALLYELVDQDEWAREQLLKKIYGSDIYFDPHHPTFQLPN